LSVSARFERFRGQAKSKRKMKIKILKRITSKMKKKIRIKRAQPDRRRGESCS